MKNRSSVQGINLDDQTRCRHWHSERDIIAIKFACCDTFYACYDCHRELADHPAERWPREVFSTEKAILCGRCRHQMTIEDYQTSDSQCPACGAGFNPRCSLHWPLYFAID